MPRHLNLSKHCVDCKDLDTCELRRKIESQDTYDVLDALFRDYLGFDIEYHLYSFICMCPNFKQRKAENPIQAIMEKALSGEELTPEETEIFTRVMEGIEGGD